MFDLRSRFRTHIPPPHRSSSPHLSSPMKDISFRVPCSWTEPPRALSSILLVYIQPHTTQNILFHIQHVINSYSPSTQAPSHKFRCDLCPTAELFTRIPENELGLYCWNSKSSSNHKNDPQRANFTGPGPRLPSFFIGPKSLSRTIENKEKLNCSGKNGLYRRKIIFLGRCSEKINRRSSGTIKTHQNHRNSPKICRYIEKSGPSFYRTKADRCHFIVGHSALRRYSASSS